MTEKPNPFESTRVLSKQPYLASAETRSGSSKLVRTVQSHAEQFIVDGEELTNRFKGVADGSTLNEQMAVWQTSITSQDNSPRYQMEELLGLGAQGLVFSVCDYDCGRKVALKTMRGSERVPTQIARFVHEAQVTAQLEHPGVVPVHELNVLPDGTLFYTMKKVEGRPLSDEIRLTAHNTDRRFHFLQIFLKICDTMSFAHSHGVLHRDLKPANIMLGDFGEVLVLDWGLSKVMGQADVFSVRSKNAAESDSGIYVTREGNAVGTPAYMSPEQARGHCDSLDIRSDIYSLGVILYEMLTQNLPYTGVDVETVMDQVAGGHIVPIVRQPLGYNISPQLAAIVHKALAPDTIDRYQQVDDLTADLQSFLAGEAVTAYADNIPERCVRFLRRNQVQVKTGAILSALFMISIAAYYMYVQLNNNKNINKDRAAAFYYQTHGLYDDALDAFKRIRAIDKNDSLALTGMSRAETQKNNAEVQKKREAEEQRKAERSAEEESRRKLRLQEVARLLADAQTAAGQTQWDDALKYYNQAFVLNEELETDDMKQLAENIALGRQAQRDAQELAQLRGMIDGARANLVAGELQRAFAKANASIENLRNDKFDLRKEVLALRDEIRSRIDSEEKALALQERKDQAAKALVASKILVAEYLHKQAELSNVSMQLAIKEDQRVPYAELQNDDKQIQRLETEIKDFNLKIVAELSRALELDPQSAPVRSAWADYYERELHRAEERGDNAGASVAATRGKYYDVEERYRLLFNEKALIRNLSQAEIHLRKLSHNHKGVLAPAGEALVIAATTEMELEYGRYLISAHDKVYQSINLKRGQIFVFSPTNLLANPEGTVFVPGGYIYDKNQFREEELVAPFWMTPHEITCGEYLEFLNSDYLMAVTGHVRSARDEYAPRNMIQRKPIWGANSEGRFRLVHILRENPAGKNMDPRLPVYGISYKSVVKFIEWKRLQTKMPWRLPTEKEWRLAAQSGDGRMFTWGDRPDNDGLCYSAQTLRGKGEEAKRSLEILENAGSYPFDQSVNGVYDLAGSLSEFVGFHDKEQHLVMICGGSYQDHDEFRFKTTSVRYVDDNEAYIQVGFRLVLDYVAPESVLPQTRQP